MAKLLKWIFIAVLGCAAFFVISIILLINLVNPNVFKDQLSSLIEKKIGREIHINGNMHWSFFPWLGIEFNNLSIANPKDFSHNNFVQVDKADIRIRSLPLFAGKVEIGKITLKNAALNLEQNKSGNNNWSFPTEKTSPQDSNISSSSTRNYSDVKISSIEIENATVNFVDQKNQQSSSTLKNLNLKSTNINFINNFPLHLDLDYTSNGTSAHINLDSHIQINPNNKAININNLKITGNYLPKGQSNLPFSLKSDLEINPQTQSLDITKLKAKINNTNLAGNLSYSKTANNFAFDLRMDQLNLNDFLQQTPNNAEKTETKISTAQNNPNTGSFKIPVKLMQQIKGTGKIQINQFSYNKIKIANITTQITANGSGIALSPLTADLYQGNSQGNILIKALNNSVNVAINETVNNVQIGDLLKDFSESSKFQLTGTGSLKTNLQTQGNNSDNLIRNLNGKINFAVTNGTFQNLNILQQIYAAITHAKSGIPSDATNQTSFSNLSGDVQINNGIATNNNLIMQSPSLQLTGRGTINLIQKSLNYTLKATALGAPFGQDIIDLQQRIGGSFPIKISGNLSNPSIRADYVETASGLLKNQFKQQIENHLGSNVSNFINGILGK